MKIYRKYEGRIYTNLCLEWYLLFSAFTDYIRPKDYLEPNAPKPINLCIDDFNAVSTRESLLNECVKNN